MISDSKALDRIQWAASHLLARNITAGEALGDIIAALEEGGRDIEGLVRAGRAPSEPRSWSRLPETAPAEAQPAQELRIFEPRASRA